MSKEPLVKTGPGGEYEYDWEMRDCEDCLFIFFAFCVVIVIGAIVTAVSG